jgi:hypothetical protein
MSRELAELLGFPGDIDDDDVRAYLRCIAAPEIRTFKAQTKKAAEDAAAQKERDRIERQRAEAHARRMEHLARLERKPADRIDLTNQSGTVFVWRSKRAVEKFIAYDRCNLISNGVAKAADGALWYGLVSHDPKITEQAKRVCPDCGYDTLNRVPYDTVPHDICSHCGYWWRSEYVEDIPAQCPKGHATATEYTSGKSWVVCANRACDFQMKLGYRPHPFPVIVRPRLGVEIVAEVV